LFGIAARKGLRVDFFVPWAFQIGLGEAETTAGRRRFVRVGRRRGLGFGHFEQHHFSSEFRSMQALWPQNFPVDCTFSPQLNEIATLGIFFRKR
jgi:hypothetical protein